MSNRLSDMYLVLIGVYDGAQEYSYTLDLNSNDVT